MDTIVHPRWVIDAPSHSASEGVAQIAAQFSDYAAANGIPTTVPIPAPVYGRAWCAFSTMRYSRKLSEEYWNEARRLLLHSDVTARPVQHHALAHASG